MDNETTIEAEIKAKGLTAPRLTPEKIDSKITAAEFYVFPGSWPKSGRWKATSCASAYTPPDLFVWPPALGASDGNQEKDMNCPFCMPDEENAMAEGLVSTEELENGACPICIKCGFSVYGLNQGVTTIAVLTLQRHLGDVLAKPNATREVH